MFGSFTKVANGNIAPSRFVKLDASATGRVLQAGANVAVFGISQPQTRRIAISGAISGTDDGYAAVADEMLNVIGPGDDEALLELGGTVAHGDPIKSDADGKGVKADTDKDHVGAIALSDGTSGKLIKVKPYRYDLAV